MTTTVRHGRPRFAVTVALFALAFLFTAPEVHAQSGVGINPAGNPAHASAGLDVDFNNRGVLIPRVALASTFDVSTIPSPATSLLVYNTALSGDVTPGFYFYTGSAWERIQSGAGGGGGGGGGDWTTVGSSTYLTNTSGRVGIGTSSPSSSYDLTIGGGIGGGILVNGSSTTSDFNGYVAIGNVSPSSSYHLQVGSNGLRVTGSLTTSNFDGRVRIGSSSSTSYDLQVDGHGYFTSGIRVNTTSSPPTGGIIVNGLIDSNGLRAGTSSSNSNGVYCTGQIRTNNYFYMGGTSTSTGTALVRNSSGEIRPTSSTIRVKENIRDLTVDREKLLQLRPVSFNLKSALGGDPDIGLIAEEVEQLVPDLVVYGYKRNWIGDTGLVEHDDEGVEILDKSDIECYGVRYEKVGLLLVPIVADHDATINSLRKENGDLQARLDRIEGLLTKLVSAHPELVKELTDGTERAEAGKD
jgi:hypothetical protein